jgi:hypothetical protein
VIEDPNYTLAIDKLERAAIIQHCIWQEN